MVERLSDLANRFEQNQAARVVTELEARQLEVDDEIANLRPVPRLPASVVHDRLDEWRRRLRASTTQARAMQRIIVARITFTPQQATEQMESGYSFDAQTRFDKLFAGVAEPTLADGSDLTGTEGITRE